ncbi:N-acetylmuramoyl-L-alanine amidase [bacterium]|nr:N-acetylmuramoyl-L-alanine amidase [bacterium]
MMKSGFFRQVSAGLILACTLLAGASRADEVVNLRVNFEDTNTYTYVNAVERHSVVYLAVEDLSRLLNLGYIAVPRKEKCVLKAGSKGVTVTAMNPFILVDNHPHQMALPSLIHAERIYVPLAIFLNICGDFIPSARYEPLSRSLYIRRSVYNITSVDIEERDNGTLIRLSTAKTFDRNDIEVIRSGDWLYITFVDGTLDTLGLASNEAIGTVRRIKSMQYDASAQISFQLQGGVTDHSLFVNDNEVMVSLRRTTTISTGTDDSSGGAEEHTAGQADKSKWLIDTIIIDPGHGGPDPGAIGRYRKTREKDVNLAIAQKLATLLTQHLNVKVLMTRNGDKRLKRDYREDLQARSKFANAQKGKLFISIHANSAESSQARGFSVYILGKASSQKAIETAMRENSVMDEEDAAGNENDQLSHILNANAHNAFQKESLDLAGIMVSEIKKRTKLPLWTDGVEQANFWVLNGTAMPSVLVETAFLSNKYEERLLNIGSEQMKIARALYESIAQFKEKHEKEIGS